MPIPNDDVPVAAVSVSPLQHAVGLGHETPIETEVEPHAVLRETFHLPGPTGHSVLLIGHAPRPPSVPLSRDTLGPKHRPQSLSMLLLSRRHTPCSRTKSASR